MKNATVTPKRARAKAPAKTEPPTAKPAGEPVREFTAAQESIIEAVSDILINGSDRKCLDGLAYSAARHQARTCCLSAYKDEPQKLEERIERAAAHQYDTWRFEIEARIRANRRAPEPERQTPADASARIRESVRSQVIDYFHDSFLSNATPEDLYLMREVLIGFDSFNRGPNSMTIALAEAFDAEMKNGFRWTFLNVPDHLMNKVEQYADALLALEGAAGGTTTP